MALIEFFDECVRNIVCLNSDEINIIRDITNTTKKCNDDSNTRISLKEGHYVETPTSYEEVMQRISKHVRYERLRFDK